MFAWAQNATVNFADLTTFPLLNFAGKVYLTYIDEVLEQQLEIAPQEKVLDIGGGSRPFGRANVVTEAFLQENMHRSGASIASHIKYIECFAEKLPFKNKEFDVALARHVFEHVKDPAKACQEIMRVAKRGFIETPSYYNSYLSDYPAHRWIVYQNSGKLVFEKKKWICNPFRNAIRGFYYADAGFRFAMDYAYRNLACTQFYWEDSFDFEILDSFPAAFDYDVPQTAALSHLDFAINALEFGFIPYEEILAELDIALNYEPDLALAHYHRGIISRLTGNQKEARKCFHLAEKIDPALKKLVKMNYPIKTLEQGNFTGSNFAGKIIPLVHGYLGYLTQYCKIKNSDRVLEMSPHRFLPQSTHIAIPEALSVGKNYFKKKNKYNLSIVSGLVEKHSDPEALFRELMRISDGGIIEVPSEMWELFNGNPANKWLFTIENGVLVVRRKPFTISPFPLVISRYIVKYPELFLSFELMFRNITYIQFTWEGTIAYKILS